MVRNAKKARADLAFYWWICRLYLAPGKRFLIWQVVTAVFNGLQPVFQAYASARFIAEVARLITANGSEQTALLWLIISAATLLLDRVVWSLDSIINSRYRHELEIVLETWMFQKMYSLSQEQFDDEAFNTRLSKASQGLYSVNRFVSDANRLVSSSVRFGSSIIAIIATAPIIGIVIFLAMLPLLLVETSINRRRQQDMEAVDRDWRLMSRTAWILQDPSRMPEIRLLGSFHDLVLVWSKLKRRIFKREVERSNYALKQTAFAELVNNAGEVFANYWFLRIAIGGGLSLDRFLFLRGLLQETTSSGNMIINSIQSMHESSLHLANLKAILETQPAIKDGTVNLNPQEQLTVEFKNVSFRYPGADSDALQNISFKISNNDRVALVGENGAGKSTIVKILLRQYLPTSGTVMVNGTNIRDLALNSYYRRVSTLFQDFSLIEHLSIKENITFGAGYEMSDKIVESVAKLVEADTFISKLKHGYDQRMLNVFEDGSQLSGGQVQRIGIARTLARRADLLILDEPTSAIDARAEYTIFKNIYESHEGKATLIISHRFSTVRQADHIVVLKDGRILELGTHEQLLSNNNLYKEMFDKQAEGYK